MFQNETGFTFADLSVAPTPLQRKQNTDATFRKAAQPLNRYGYATQCDTQRLNCKMSEWIFNPQICFNEANWLRNCHVCFTLLTNKFTAIYETLYTSSTHNISVIPFNPFNKIIYERFKILPITPNKWWSPLRPEEHIRFRPTKRKYSSK